MRILFLDCFSGISGDMTVGALCDLGVKPSTFEWELSKLAIGDFHMHFERRHRQKIEGVKFGIHAGAVHTHDQDEDEEQTPSAEHEHAHSHAHEHEDSPCECEHGHTHEHEHGHKHHHHHDHEEEAEHGHEHAHGHEEHAHAHSHEHKHGHGHAHTHEHEHAHEPGRSYADIRALIDASDLSDFVKRHAQGIFRRLAVAEGKIHGLPVEDVHFHEVGALDSIADIVCACVGIEALGVEQIFVSPLSEGRGFVECAHGHFPIPAPATLEVLRGIPLGQIDEPYEFITPTGAAIAAEFAQSFGPMPRMKIEKIGYGVGARHLSSRPNVLRAVVGEMFHVEQTAAEQSESNSASGYETDTVSQIETNLDDLSPELTGAVVDRLLSAGALDVFLTPAQMKKNRPGVLLTALCEPEAAGRMADLIFAETSAFGLRMSRKERLKLERRIETVETPCGPVSVKLGFKAGRMLQAAPEFESCRAVAERTGRPLREMYLLAAQAAGGKYGDQSSATS
jgi:uncharacterized protein (TIGR00299 family) protein